MIIPNTPNRSRMQGIPRTQIGGTVTAEDMGAGQARDWMRLGQAGQQLGNTMMGVTIQRDHERAEAEMLAAVNAKMEADAKERNRIQTLKGSAADNAPKLMEEAAKKSTEEQLQLLKSPYAKEMFLQRMNGYDRQNAVAVDAYMIQEQDRTRLENIDATVYQLENDAILNVGNGAVLAGNIRQIKELSAQRYAGASPEFIDMKNQQAAARLAENYAAALASSPEGGPQAALDFLNSGIDAEIGSGELKVKFDALRKMYQQSIECTGVTQAAHEYVLNGGSSAGLLQEAWERYPNPQDEGKRNLFIVQGDSMLARLTDDENRTASEYNTQKWQDLVASNYDMNTINEVMKVDPVLGMQMASFVQTVNASGMKGAVPDINSLDKLYEMEPETLRAYLANPENYSDFLLAAAGDSAEAKRIQDKSRMNNEEWRQKQAGGVSGGRFGDFDLDPMFINNFKQFGNSPGLGWIWDSEYDPKNAKHTNFKSNVIAQYKYRWSRPEEYPGRTPQTRAEDLFYDLITNSTEGKIDLTKPTYELYQASLSSDTQEIVVAREELTPNQLAIVNSGPEGRVVARQLGDNARQLRFKEIDPKSTGLHENIRSLNPVRVEQNLDVIQRSDIVSSPGEYQVTLEDGRVHIFTMASERTSRIYIDPQQTGIYLQSLRRGQAARGVQAALGSANTLPSEVTGLKKKYPEEGAVTERKVGDSVIVQTPEGTYFYNAVYGNRYDFIPNEML